MNSLDRAIELAVSVHKGQVDKSNSPYILHPLRLMLQFQCEAEQIVAVLHDVVEDGDIRLETLRDMGFLEEVVAAIDCLTRRDGESYEEFIGRVAANRLATRVKIADLLDNLNVARLSHIADSDLRRIEKYHAALSRLRQIAWV